MNPARSHRDSRCEDVRIGRVEAAGHLFDLGGGGDQRGREADGVTDGTYQQAVLLRAVHQCRADRPLIRRAR